MLTVIVLFQAVFCAKASFTEYTREDANDRSEIGLSAFVVLVQVPQIAHQNYLV
jgi:hypothetical protein